MRKRGRKLYHGGAKGLRCGDILLPDMAHTRYVEGCPCCEAQRRGEGAAIDPPTPAEWVYATSHRLYARYYASRAVGGDLYRVVLIGDAELSGEDRFPTWRARSARVVGVVERGVMMTMRERRYLFKRWGGTDAEFDALVDGVLRGAA